MQDIATLEVTRDPFRTMSLQSHGRSNSASSNAPMATAYAARPRKRTAHACDACRMRKSRCDGRQPCSWCTENEVDCLYGQQQPTLTQGKSDKILETVLRMDEMLRGIHESLSDKNQARSLPSPRFSNPSSPDHDFAKVANATIPSTHISATEDLLSSSFAAPFPSLRQQISPVFQLESHCPPIPFHSRSIRPVFTAEEAGHLLSSFQANVNFWYPIVSKTTLQTLYDRAQNGFIDNSCDDCAALLVMALGAASEFVNLVHNHDGPHDFESRQHQSELMAMASVCFDEAMKLLTVAYMEISTRSTQCIFLAALYCSFLQRPLQTWSHISTAAAKSRALIACGPNLGDSEDDECVRRIFWSCYIIESDLISELKSLPQSGIAEVESEVPLPGPLQTHFTDAETEASALYFLSCISIRRLLNRVHHLLYAKDKHQLYTESRDESLKGLIAELDRQLVLWRDTLPEFLLFEDDTQECANERASFLRQRYLACKSVIYRPYVEIVLNNPDIVHSRETIEAAGRCLTASCHHIANLRSFGQTVMVDTWICTLSMTSTMFIILVSLQIPALRPNLLMNSITEYGPNLRRLLSSWIGIMPHKSPSIQQSIQLISEIEVLIKDTRG